MLGQDVRLVQELVLGVVRYVDSRCRDLAGELEVREVIAEADELYRRGIDELDSLRGEFPWLLR